MSRNRSIGTLVQAILVGTFPQFVNAQLSRLDVGREESHPAKKIIDIGVNTPQGVFVVADVSDPAAEPGALAGHLLLWRFREAPLFYLFNSLVEDSDQVAEALLTLEEQFDVEIDAILSVSPFFSGTVAVADRSQASRSSWVPSSPQAICELLSLAEEEFQDRDMANLLMEKFDEKRVQSHRSFRSTTESAGCGLPDQESMTWDPPSRFSGQSVPDHLHAIFLELRHQAEDGEYNPCNDNNMCTIDKCINGTCSYTPNNGPCPDDGKICTDDICYNRKCTHPPNTRGPCQSDNNPCTLDICRSGACKHEPISGPACEDDNNPCTQDVCVEGGCAHLPISGPECTDDGIKCTDDICEDGECTHPTIVCPDSFTDPCIEDGYDGYCHPCYGCQSTPLCYDGDDCTSDLCDPDDRMCSFPELLPPPDGAANCGGQDCDMHLAPSLTKISVNDDDDNANGVADYLESGVVTNETDLAPVVLSFADCPPDLPGCSSSSADWHLCEGGGNPHLRYFRTSNKGTNVGHNLEQLWPPPSSGTVYMEGIKPTNLCGAPTYFWINYGSCCWERGINVRVRKIRSVTWSHPGTGTGGCVFNSGNANLELCPNNGGVRIFPDKLDPEDDSASVRRKIDLVVTIDPPEAGVTVFYRVFDVDDPFDQLHGIQGANDVPNVTLIDSDLVSPDNRPLGNDPAVVTSAVITDSQGQARASVTVSMQPGNNYRAGASLISGAVDQAMSRGTADKLSVRVDPQTGKYARYGEFTGYYAPLTWSPMLTVWRKLHVERDSMGPVTGNQLVSTFTDFVGSGTALTEIRGLSGLDDGSLNLDRTSPENGRFEKGSLVIGTVPSTITISPLTGNGFTRVVFPTTSIAGLSFSAIDNDSFGNGTLSGTITQVTKSGINFVWTLNVTAHNETPIDWPDFVGGTLSVGGGSNVSIVAANAVASQLTTSALNIPCTLRDDDDNSLLPKLPDTSTMAAAYQPAYVVPVYDVGDNNMNVPFVLNLTADNAAIDAALDWDSRSLNATDFWVGYVLESFQYQASNADNDPDSEAESLGATQSTTGGSVIFLEVHQSHEGTADPTTEEQVTVVHETGHAVGDSNDHPVTGNEDRNSTFVADYLVHIRSSTKPRS